MLVIAVEIRLRDYGVLDFDAGDARRQPPVDTTWQQVSDACLIIKSAILDYLFSLLYFSLV